jgi:histidine triad (HIT) family protein
MSRDPNCIFCKIVAGEMPAHRVSEDERALVFMDIFPVSDGHTLIIPKAHHPDIFSADEESLRAVAAMARRVSHAIREILSPAGLMVFQLNGAAAGQTVFHYHMHLLPRWPDQPLALHTRVPGEPARLTELAERLAQVVGRGD